MYFGRLAISRPVCWFTNARIVSRLTGTIARFLFIYFLSPVFALSLGIILLDAWDSPNRRWSIPFIRVGIGDFIGHFHMKTFLPTSELCRMARINVKRLFA